MRMPSASLSLSSVFVCMCFSFSTFFGNIECRIDCCLYVVVFLYPFLPSSAECKLFVCLFVFSHVFVCFLNIECRM